MNEYLSAYFMTLQTYLSLFILIFPTIFSLRYNDFHFFTCISPQMSLFLPETLTFLQPLFNCYLSNQLFLITSIIDILLCIYLTRIFITYFSVTAYWTIHITRTMAESVSFTVSSANSTVLDTNRHSIDECMNEQIDTVEQDAVCMPTIPATLEAEVRLQI